MKVVCLAACFSGDADFQLLHRIHDLCFLGLLLCVRIFQTVVGMNNLKAHLKHFFTQSARFIGYSLLGAGFAAVLLLPTFYSLLGRAG